MKRAFILFLIFFYTLSNAQSIDSLVVVANNIRDNYGENDERYLEALSNIVKATDDFAVAYRYRKKYYEIVKDKFGTESPEYADACVRMGTVSSRHIGVEEGFRYYQEGVTLYEKLGVINYSYIGGLSLMCDILDKQGQEDNAFIMRERLINKLETVEKDYIHITTPNRIYWDLSIFNALWKDRRTGSLYGKGAKLN